MTAIVNNIYQICQAARIVVYCTITTMWSVGIVHWPFIQQLGLLAPDVPVFYKSIVNLRKTSKFPCRKYTDYSWQKSLSLESRPWYTGLLLCCFAYKTNYKSVHVAVIPFEKNAEQASNLEIVNEYDQEIPQSQTADNPVAPWGRAAQPSRDTRKTN